VIYKINRIFRLFGDGSIHEALCTGQTLMKEEEIWT